MKKKTRSAEFQNKPKKKKTREKKNLPNTMQETTWEKNLKGMGIM